MRLKLLFLFLALSITATFSIAQTGVQTSFETTEGFNAGNINGQQGWVLSSGNGVVTTAKFHTGMQSLNLGAAASALLVNYVSYAGNIPGITGEVYADFWVNPGSFTTKGIAINGMDLFGGSSKRIFVLEFGTDGNIKAYNGSSAVNIAAWTANEWVRLSVKMDFVTEKYRVAINTLLHATEFSFRETYTPTASGTRAAGIKEFHSLRFNHLADATFATSDAAFDDLYVGTTAIADVSFGASSTIRTITVTQPEYGSIALSPAAPYSVGQTVTATLTLPQGYMNNGWTGDISGTELVKTIVLNNNISIGADVGIDENNPPPKYMVTVNQPANGSIVLSPASPDNMYYRETKLTATVSAESCYQFDGWTGSLSGTQNPASFTVQNAATIGATVSLITIPPVKRTVNTVANFKTALANMNPGDTVEVENGMYDLSSLSVVRSGCQLKPIVITAKNKGQAILNGATALVFKNMSYVTLKGFAFRSVNIGTGIKLENCTKFRITENSFALTESSSCTWVYIGDTYASPLPLRSGYNRIDHNSFDGKTQAGNYIRMDGNIDQQSRYDTIDHNHFKNNGPRANNEKESIRVGVSTLSKSSGFTLIEYNLFEDCDGDPEIVSVKSCDNTIRYNTFVRCLGTLCLRQGFRSKVEGNYFFGDNKTGTFNGGTIGAGGIRVYGKDHQIINNYFSGLTGAKWDAAITITNGDVTNSSTSLADHYLPENIVVAHNTLVDNESNIEIGFNNNGNYPLSPINCMIANNIVIENRTPIIKVHNAAALNGVSFSNNMMYATGTATLGITASAAEIIQADPKLVLPVCVAPASCSSSNASKVMRLAPSSPAINAGTGTYNDVLLDYELQPRTGVKDIGADEYDASPIITVQLSALSAQQVGPDGTDEPYSYTLATALPVKIIQFEAGKNNGATRLLWTTSGEEHEKYYEIEWSSDASRFVHTGTVPAAGAGMRQYSFDDAMHVKGSNYYRLKIIKDDGSFSYSSIVAIHYSFSLVTYPNPVIDELIIEMPGSYSAATGFTILNAEGRVVYSQRNKNPAGQCKIPMRQFPAGLYFLQVFNKTGMMLNKKIIKN